MYNPAYVIHLNILLLIFSLVNITILIISSHIAT